MAVPKRKKSKSSTRQNRAGHFTRKVVKAVKTKDGKSFKRAHIEEKIEL